MWNASLDFKQSDLFMDPERLEQSHWRSYAAGVNRDLTRLKHELNSPGLDKFISRYAALSAYSRLLFSDIYRDLSDRNYVFILTDEAARLIVLYSCPEILDNMAEGIGLRPGVLLSEESCGTNAIALTLRYREPMVTRGEQHYSRLFHRWCAVAAPVMDANRQPIACIAISNCQDMALAEKLALVKFIVKDIEGFHRVTTDVPEAKRSSAPLNGVQLAADLTPRQHQVLTLFAKGLSYKQIARQLAIGSTKTVEEHLDAVRGKLHVSHRRECIQKAMTLGLLQD